jgi:inner membrane protein
VQANDLKKFSFFSAGFVALKPNNAGQIIVADMRYSMLPQSLAPLWGITLNAKTPQSHVAFGSFRQNTPTIRQQFWSMLTGQGGKVWVATLALNPKSR